MNRLWLFSTRSGTGRQTKLRRGVAHQRAGQHPGLGEHLEAVADADHRNAAARRLLDRLHDRRAGRHRAGAEVVAVGEAAGNADEVDAVGQPVSRCQTISGLRPVTCSSATARSRSQLEPGRR